MTKIVVDDDDIKVSLDSLDDIINNVALEEAIRWAEYSEAGQDLFTADGVSINFYISFVVEEDGSWVQEKVFRDGRSVVLRRGASLDDLDALTDEEASGQ